MPYRVSYGTSAKLLAASLPSLSFWMLRSIMILQQNVKPVVKTRCERSHMRSGWAHLIVCERAIAPPD